MSIFGTLVAGVFVAVAAAFILGRYALYVGLFALILGIAPMGALYVYERFFYEKGDTSSYGMAATISFLLFVPFGIIATALGAIRRL